MMMLGALLLCASFSLTLIAAYLQSYGHSKPADVLCIFAGVLFAMVTSYGHAEWVSIAMGALGTTMAIIIMLGLAYVLKSLRRVRPPTE